MNTAFRTEADIVRVVKGFEDRTLPKEQWTHEAHLVTAIFYHAKYSEHEAICFLRSGIIAFNVAKGGKNTPEDGYHETLTLFWCKTVNDFVSANRGLSLLNLCKKFLASDAALKGYPLRFYSHKVLMSRKARAVWVEPDLVAG